MGRTAEMSAEVISALRGKVIKKNNKKVEYGHQDEPWSPFNANMHMQGIKVVVKEPMPEEKKGDAFEKTMLLLEMMKNKKKKENEKQKEDLIPCMAMEKKRLLNEKSQNQYLKLTF